MFHDQYLVNFLLASMKLPKLQVVHPLMTNVSPGNSQPWLEDMIAKSGITKQWQRGQLSNFDYLMKLNTFAGRTYNDLSQYPVMPWVIHDYTSAKLDLKDPKIYRDLSKPMGIQDPTRVNEVYKRYQELKELYDNWERRRAKGQLDPFEPPPTVPYHYGSHYSNAGFVLYYLLRLEPYTTYARILQGGNFDHADRMFNSIPQTYANIMGASDYKELTPEFFYLPEFLCNRNGVDFGTRQNLSKVTDVSLPPWASSAEEFIRINRMALESDYVSEHLHEWIDLIFGEKQRGPEGVNALNMFYYLTYEGTVDIDAITDPIQRDSIIAQIENFGQTPMQLFKKPHPKRNTVESNSIPTISTLSILMVRPVTSHPIIHLKLFQQYNTMGTEKDTLINVLPFFNTSYGVSMLSKLMVVTSDGLVYVGKVNAASLAQGQLEGMTAKSIGFPFLSNQFNLMSTTAMSSPNIDDPKNLQLPTYAQIIAIPSTPVPSNNRDINIYSAHHWDNSFRLSKPFVNNQYNERKVLLCQEKAIWRHKDLVTCCALCERDQVLVTGSRDTTIMVWSTEAFESSNPQPLQVLYGHDDEITCVAVSSDLDVVVSGSKDSTVIVHTLGEGAYIRTIKHPTQGCIDLLALASWAEVDSIAHGLGNIIMYSRSDMMMYLFSLNGKLLHQVDTSEVLHVLKIHDSKYVIYGGEKGYIFIRRLHDLSFVCRYDCREFGSAIRSVDLSHDERFLFVGLHDGRLIIYGRKEEKKE